jgi:hypothetical protein
LVFISISSIFQLNIFVKINNIKTNTKSKDKEKATKKMA